MGTNFVQLGEFGFWANDGHTEMCLLLLVREIDLLPDFPEWLVTARKNWFLYGTEALGGLSPCFNTYLISNDRLDYFLPIAERALNGIFDGHDPDMELPKCTGWGFYHPTTLDTILAAMVPRPKAILIETSKLMMQVLRGEMPWKVSDPESVFWMRELEIPPI